MYLLDHTKIGIINSILTGETLDWMSLLLEQSRPISNNLNDVIHAFLTIVNDLNYTCMAEAALHSLKQSCWPTSACTAHFHCLIVDTEWNEAAQVSPLLSRAD